MSSADPSTTTSSLAPPKPFSISLSSKSKPKPGKPAPTSTSAPSFSALSSGARKRPYSALADPDSDHEDQTAINGHHEAVVGFGVDGRAISVSDASNKKQPLVIKAEKNQDWRGESRRKRGKNLLPAEVQAQQQQQGKAQEEPAGTIERSEVSTEGGLKIAQRTQADEAGDVAMEGAQTNGEGRSGDKKMTADEEAIAALLGDEKKKSTLTIPSTGDKAAETNGHNHDLDAYTDEADRFRADVDSRPPPASLADYAAVPVEEFGAAILRGLGWKEGEPIDKRGQAAAAPREVKRRPALLGIGAKETPGGVPAEELGAWNQKKGRRKDKVAYNPVMLKNSITGEMVTEEEMELRKLEAKQGKGKEKGTVVEEEDWRERKKTGLGIEKGKEKQRLAIEYSDERAGNRSWGRERERNRGDQRDRRRERDYVSSRGERTRSGERNKYASSRRERSPSSEQKHRRNGNEDDDHNRRHRDRGSHGREKDTDYKQYDRNRDFDRRERERVHKRH